MTSSKLYARETERLLKLHAENIVERLYDEVFNLAATQDANEAGAIQERVDALKAEIVRRLKQAT